MITFEDDTCTEPLPEKISTYHARITGHYLASCIFCDFLSVFWECACDLEHDCGDYK